MANTHTHTHTQHSNTTSQVVVVFLLFGIEFAGEITQAQNLAKVPAARSYAMAQLIANGVEFHSLSDDQLAEWQAAGGYQRSEWDEFKTELAGSMDNFAKMEEAAGTQGKYFVHDA